MLIWTSKTQVMAKRRVESQTISLTLDQNKVGNQPDLLGRRGRATYRWKAFDESCNVVSNNISIQGLFAKLWGSKIAGVLTGAISRLPLGSPGVATLLWGKCEVATHTPKNGTWESFGTLKNLKRNCRGQNTL